ncbi:MAG: peptidase M48, partial [Ramlibacter sp.]
ARAPATGLGMEHALLAARARVLSNPGVDVLRAQVREVDTVTGQPPARQAGNLYAAALASAKLRNLEGAARLAARLAPMTEGDAKATRLARLLAAEVALIAGDPARSLTLAGPLGSGRPELLLAAQAELQSARAPAAVQRLQTWVAVHPRDATAWQLLSSAYTAQGQTLRAIRADAEAQVAWLDYGAAMDRFKAAQELVRKGGASNDHIEASIIDTRARQVELLLREQALER